MRLVRTPKTKLLTTRSPLEVNLFGTNVCKRIFVRAWACGNGLASKLQEAVLEGAPGPPGDARRKPSFPKTNLVPCTDVDQFFYWCWSSVAQHLPDAPVDRDDDEAGCVVADSPLSLVGWGSGAESVTVSGPPGDARHQPPGVV